jgi:mitotic spindle assembly checkpoint protein MAD2B
LSLWFSISVGADVFCEFVEIAIHCILHTRGLYPTGVFEKRKKYNVPVNVSIATVHVYKTK